MSADSSSTGTRGARRPPRVKSPRASKLNDETWDTIVNFIQLGSWDYVAAEAAGVDYTTFWRWMKRGEDGEQPFHDFYRAVVQARAIARLRYEVEVGKRNPLAWLRYGPGKEQPGRPGWTEATKVEVSGPDGGAIDISVMDISIKKAAQKLLASPEGNDDDFID